MKTANTVLNAIAELNLEPIKNKLMDAEHGEGWSRAKVEAMDLEYRRFLHLMHAFPNHSASPTKAVDTFWHYHILDTQKYAADCDQVFGCFMHHDPYGNEQGASAGTFSIDRMQDLYEATFGEAYIRTEVYGLDEIGIPAGSAVGQRNDGIKINGAKASVCQTFCMMQKKSTTAKGAVCQTFCMMLTKPTAASITSLNTCSLMQAKPAAAKTTVCQTFCMMQAKPAAAKAAVCQTFCMMQSKQQEKIARQSESFV